MGKVSGEAGEARAWTRVGGMETAWRVDGRGQRTDRVDPDLRARIHDWILTTYQAEKEEGIPQPPHPPAAERLASLVAPTPVRAGLPAGAAPGRAIAPAV